MSDADDAELLTPTTSSQASRATYPFTRTRNRESSDGNAEGSTGSLRVVYDRQFDRFFLQGDSSSPLQQCVTAKSPKPQRAGTRTPTMKKRPPTVGIQWEDLILPPRSVTKKSGGTVTIKYDGLSEEAACAEIVNTPVNHAKEQIDPTTARHQLTTQKTESHHLSSRAGAESQERGTTGTRDRSAIFVHPALSPESLSTPRDSTNRSVHIVTVPGLVAQIDRQSTNLEATTMEAAAMKTLVVQPEENPIRLVAGGHDASPQTLVSESAITPSPSESPSAHATAVASNDSIVQESNTGDWGKAVAVSVPVSTPISVSEPAPMPLQPSEKRDSGQSRDTVGSIADSGTRWPPAAHEAAGCTAPSMFTAAVRLVRVLRRYSCKRHASLQQAAPAQLLILDSERENATPAVVLQEAPRSQSLDVGPDQTPLLQDNAPPISALHLDLSKLPVHGPLLQRKPRSPLRSKSPQKKTRIPSYARHFEVATEGISASSSSCLRIDNQHEHAVRWQGEVAHVHVAMSTATNDWVSSQPRTTQVQTEPYPLIHHVYSLRDLARIRPHADGFRRVNEACTFTALTSSSESSESEDDQVAIVQVPSSSDDEEENIQFQRGDIVLFHARHRWFKGTILKRIKQSWFYDIRAANGSVFEAVQAKRIRKFDGQDEEPKQNVFAIGDRVLWRPKEAMNQSARQQNYKARIVSIRRPRSPRQARKQSGKRYDVELLTGRVVMRISHDELHPLRHTR